jgi:hypothetical protein
MSTGSKLNLFIQSVVSASRKGRRLRLSRELGGKGSAMDSLEQRHDLPLEVLRRPNDETETRGPCDRSLSSARRRALVTVLGH